MQLLGRIKNVSHEGRLIVKGNFAPAENATVIDSMKRKIGKVLRVFGPTRAPYIAIKPSSGLKSLALVGQELYIRPEGEDGKNKRRDGAGRKMPGM